MINIFKNDKREIKKKRREAYNENFKNNYEIEPFFSSDYNEPSDIDLITVAFNAPRLIEYQIKLIKKFVSGNYRIIIADNSTVEEHSKAIKEICTRENVTYIRSKDRKLPKGYSNSHAIALNWIYKNVVKKRENNFAYLDHDLFPIKEVNASLYVKDDPVYGVRYFEGKSDIWYLWPGFSFFNYKHVSNLPLNFDRYKTLGFIKKKNVDTGSGNWTCLYSKIDEKKLKSCSQEGLMISKNEIVKCGYPLGEDEVTITCFDDRKWLHILDGADRYSENKDRITLVLKYLDTLLCNQV